MADLVLVALNHESPARTLVNELKRAGIAALYRYGDQTYSHEVVLEDDAQLAEAKRIAQEFLANPTDRRYQGNAWQDAEHVALTRSDVLPPFSWRDMLSAPMTLIVLALCMLVYLGSVLGMFWPLRNLLGIQPLQMLADNHQWWRLIGPAFLHFSAVHLVFNLLWWWSLGSQIERRFGTSTLCLLFFLAALTSNLAQLWVSGPNFGGLSGVVYAVVGFVWWVGWLRPDWGLGLSKPLIGFLLLWLVLGYMDVLWVDMANTAHTVGLVSGCLMAWLLVRFTHQRA